MFDDSTQWDRVCTFSADKLAEMGQLALFTKKLHALEAEKARELAKLCEKFLQGVPAEKRGVLERVMAAAAATQQPLPPAATLQQGHILHEAGLTEKQ